MRRILMACGAALLLLGGVALGQNYERVIGGSERLILMSGGLKAWELLGTGEFRPVPGSNGSINAAAVSAALTASPISSSQIAANAVQTSQINAGAVVAAKLGTDVGAWQSQTYAAGDYSAGGSMTFTVDSGDVGTNRYMVIGKTLFYEISISNTVLGGTPNAEVRIKIPGGYTAASSMPTIGTAYSGALTPNYEFTQVFPSSQTIAIYRAQAGSWPNGTYSMWLQGMIEVQ